MWMFTFTFINSRQSLLVIHSYEITVIYSFNYHTLANVACGPTGQLPIHYSGISFVHLLISEIRTCTRDSFKWLNYQMTHSFIWSFTLKIVIFQTLHEACTQKLQQEEDLILHQM